MVFRLDPAGPHGLYRTFRASAPLATHHRRVTCAEHGCEKLERGFKIITDPTTDKGRRQRYLIRDRYRHSHPSREVRRPDGLVEYVFPAGTPCFDNHYRPLFREPLTVIRYGDWRTPAAARRPQRVGADEWLERFGENQQAVADRARRG